MNEKEIEILLEKILAELVYLNRTNDAIIKTNDEILKELITISKLLEELIEETRQVSRWTASDISDRLIRGL